MSEPTTKPRLLIIEDDEDVQIQMKWGLSPEYEVLVASDRASAIATQGEAHAPLVTLDLGLPPAPLDIEEGFATLRDLLHIDPDTKVVIITGRDERKHALRAVQEGAHDLFHKPIQMDELQLALRRAHQLYALGQENRHLHRRNEEAHFEQILGTSEAMQIVFETIRKVANTDASVLITGESGSGKELVAGALHARSGRNEGPFVVINCGAIPENLLESELFGYERGAFTGALTQRSGKIESAAHGTLFLDEVGDLTSTLQVKLLRFLQERTIERVGGRELIEVDTRVLAATNVNLQRAMQEGGFREDLYYRLAVVVVDLPPLRDRADDVLLLARTMVERFAREGAHSIKGLSPEAERAILAHPWPGNVRELENRIRRATIMSDRPYLSPIDLELQKDDVATTTTSLKEARAAFERDFVAHAMQQNGGNISRAAAQLGISRPTLYELLDRHGLRARPR